MTSVGAMCVPDGEAILAALKDELIHPRSD
jgi:hypothetical protein